LALALEQSQGIKVINEELDLLLKDLNPEDEGGVGLVAFAALAGFHDDFKQWKQLFDQVDTDGSGMADPGVH